MAFRDRLTIVTSITAFTLSLFNFGEQHLWNQRSLKGAVVAIQPPDSQITVTLLLTNEGKHYETLYSAGFVFSDDLSSGGGRLSQEKIGPIVLAPGEAVIETLTARMPSITDLREDGTIPASSSGVHVGVEFVPVQPSGEVTENAKIFTFTELQYSGERVVGTRRRRDDSRALLNLF